MKNTGDLINKVKDAFTSKIYRHAYVDEFLNLSIATQIKVLREQRGWTQEELAKYAQMKQPRISVLENVNYSSWSINTLRKLAETFDLALSVSFESFGTRLKDVDQINREALERYSFDNDPAFVEKPEEGTANAVRQAINALAESNKITDFAHARVINLAAEKARREQIKIQKETMMPKKYEKYLRKERLNEATFG